MKLDETHIKVKEQRIFLEHTGNSHSDIFFIKMKDTSSQALP